MPTEDRTEHDFIAAGDLHKTDVTLKEFLLGVMNERDRKYDQRFAAIDRAISEVNENIKKALDTATANTKDALNTATANTKDALTTAQNATREALVAANKTTGDLATSVDARFAAVNEFRQSLADQQAFFVRQTDLEQRLTASKEAFQKSETMTEKRLEGLNAFRQQIADAQAEFMRKSEAVIRFEALEKKMDVAILQLQENKGRASGLNAAWAIIAVVASLVVAVAGVVVSLFMHH